MDLVDGLGRSVVYSPDVDVMGLISSACFGGTACTERQPFAPPLLACSVVVRAQDSY